MPFTCRAFASIGWKSVSSKTWYSVIQYMLVDSIATFLHWCSFNQSFSCCMSVWLFWNFRVCFCCCWVLLSSSSSGSSMVATNMSLWASMSQTFCSILFTFFFLAAELCSFCV